MPKGIYERKPLLDPEEEALLGGPPRNRGGRPSGPTSERPIGPLSNRALQHSAMIEEKELDARLAERRREREERSGMISTNITEVHAGVTVAWLSQVFGMDPSTVKKRLADCPVLHRRKAGFVYDLKTAAPFLIKPVFDVKAYLKGMKPSELPSHLTKEYWDAALKRQKWEENAGDLWRTSRVLDVLSDTFKMMKTTMILWTEDLERETGLTEEQRIALVRYVDQLQNDISKNLVDSAMTSSTLSQQSEIEVEELFANEQEEDLVG